RWDQALEEKGVAAQLPVLIQLASGSKEPQIVGAESDWTQWMNESRQHLQASVYTEAMLTAVANADANHADGIETDIIVSEGYIEEMQRISSQRLSLAGLRLAIWFENSLD
ncbi:MAG: hypothetical protein AB8B95_08310, partial [Pseudohongiellaceae bacterium]